MIDATPTAISAGGKNTYNWIGWVNVVASSRVNSQAGHPDRRYLLAA